MITLQIYGPSLWPWPWQQNSDSKTIFLQDTLTHDDAPPYYVGLQTVQKIPSRHSTKFWIFAVTLNIVKQSFHIIICFIMYHQTIFGSKTISSSIILDSMSHVKIANHIFGITPKLLKMYHHTKFGYKRLSGSKDLVWTNNWNFENSL